MVRIRNFYCLYWDLRLFESFQFHPEVLGSMRCWEGFAQCPKCGLSSSSYHFYTWVQALIKLRFRLRWWVEGVPLILSLVQPSSLNVDITPCQGREAVLCSGTEISSLPLSFLFPAVLASSPFFLFFPCKICATTPSFITCVSLPVLNRRLFPRETALLRPFHLPAPLLSPMISILTVDRYLADECVVLTYSPSHPVISKAACLNPWLCSPQITTDCFETQSQENQHLQCWQEVI